MRTNTQINAEHSEKKSANTRYLKKELQNQNNFPHSIYYKWNEINKICQEFCFLLAGCDTDSSKIATLTSSFFFAIRLPCFFLSSFISLKILASDSLIQGNRKLCCTRIYHSTNFNKQTNILLIFLSFSSHFFTEFSTEFPGKLHFPFENTIFFLPHNFSKFFCGGNLSIFKDNFPNNFNWQFSHSRLR